jgi:hypothetical protein
MESDFSETLAGFATSTPKFIEIQGSMRRDGDIAQNQLIKLSSEIFAFSNAVKVSWAQVCAKLEKNSYRYSSESKSKPLDALMDRIRKDEPRADQLEGLIRDSEVKIFTEALLLPYEKSDTLDDSMTECIQDFLKWKTANRKLSNHIRHYGEPNHVPTPEDIEIILTYLNNTDFAVIIPRIAKASCYVRAVIEFDLEDCFSSKFDLISERIDNACRDPEESSLKIYQKRLNKLEWGPKQYKRDMSILRIAHDALEKYPIVSFYGLGGVGKTALAQKLMFDIINNREPFTHIVTHSSKVGSDQKEINTIAPSRYGIMRETDGNVSVMETSLFEDEGVRVIGGLRSLLLKIYNEVTKKSGDKYDDNKLRKVVFNELNKAEHQMLIIVDNYEDVEDNQDDGDVQQIKNDIRSFLTEFSRLSGDVKSRIIITTRSTPLDIAHGIEVKHLTKNEAANLFLEKIRFRSNRANKVLNLQQILTEAHQLFSQAPKVFDELIDSFDFWHANDEYIAHPLFVLLAAEEVEQAKISHIIDVIQSWSDGQKAKDVIEYCVSKTFGSVTEGEQLVLKLLVVEGHAFTDINNQYIRKLIDKATSPNSSIKWLNDSDCNNLSTITDDNLIDLMNRMSYRTFVQFVPKNTMGGGMCYHWNKLVYEYLQTRFEVVEKPKPTIVDSKTIELRPYPPSYKFLSTWTEAEVVTGITRKEILDPLEKSITEMTKELQHNIDSKPLQYDLNSLITNLDYQSLSLIKLLEKIVQTMKSDQQLTGIQKTKTLKSVDVVLDTLLKCLGRQARCWRYAATLDGTGYPSSICIQYSIYLLDALRQRALIFLDAGIISLEQFVNLFDKIGLELIEIDNADIELNETQTERLNSARMYWLQSLAEYYKPQNCKLRDGLGFSAAAYSSFENWVGVFTETYVMDSNNQIYLLEGYAFWIILRMLATDTSFLAGKDTTILDEWKKQGLAIRNKQNINQYIRSVQSSLEQIIVDPSDYLDNILLFRSQPRNGTLFISKLRYDSYYSRWSINLQSKLKVNWALIVNETDRLHGRKNYEKVILKQISIDRTNRKIIASFYLDDNDGPIIEPEKNMKIQAELEKQWAQQINKLIKERKKETRNEISLTEIRRILNKSNGPRDEDSISEIVQRHTSLVKNGRYYIIDSSKPHSRPPFGYEEVDGGKNAFTQIGRRDRIQLPRDPARFAVALHHFISMVHRDKSKTITMLEYSREVENGYDMKYQSGAFLIFLALHDYEHTWLEKEIIDLRIEWGTFVKSIERVVIGKCDVIRRDFGYEIPSKVIKLYFQDVLECAPINDESRDRNE